MFVFDLFFLFVCLFVWMLFIILSYVVCCLFLFFVFVLFLILILDCLPL